MKNFIMLTDIDGRTFGVSVSSIKYWAKDGVVSRIYFEDFHPRATNFRTVRESVEDIKKRIEKATEKKATFVQFLFVNGNEKLCVKASTIRYLKAGEGKLHKVFIEGMGEVEVYGDFYKIVESLDSVTVYGC